MEEVNLSTGVGWVFARFAVRGLSGFLEVFPGYTLVDTRSFVFFFVDQVRRATAVARDEC